MNRTLYAGLLKLKNSVLILPVVNYIKAKHPGFWMRMKTRLLIPKPVRHPGAGIAMDCYTQDFVDRLTAEVEYRERLGR